MVILHEVSSSIPGETLQMDVQGIFSLPGIEWRKADLRGVKPISSVPGGGAPEQEPGLPLLPSQTLCRSGYEGLDLVPVQPALIREQDPVHIMSLQDNPASNASAD